MEHKTCGEENTDETHVKVDFKNKKRKNRWLT